MVEPPVELIDQRDVDSTGENSAAAGSLLHEAIRMVRPDLAGELDLNMPYPRLLRDRASEEDIDAVSTILRPYAERSFADPRARYITWYLIALGIKDIDASYIADDIEFLQHTSAMRAISDDADLLTEIASPANIHHINRVLRLNSEEVRSAQRMIIANGVKKKFFRQAPELKWIKDSHLRGLGPRTAKALDRMGT